ncbi:hypothetical protein BB559_001940 [Furculomyces boomerangus]|uniref:Uncharacterized protein n=2 Tax=Harpellales TaxID=61421 RepID=A0A2T9YZ75_9FUNG|nr:hypothetical protein BB559_002664 [Furculomyces boomerangus]PVU97643.1 hypothetical protein BB559_001940 [Furculomyces boomerangus]PWA02772.1 hypothetical protein BB558_001080 [Smittium angustum]
MNTPINNNEKMASYHPGLDGPTVVKRPRSKRYTDLSEAFDFVKMNSSANSSPVSVVSEPRKKINYNTKTGTPTAVPKNRDIHLDNSILQYNPEETSSFGKLSESGVSISKNTYLGAGNGINLVVLDATRKKIIDCKIFPSCTLGEVLYSYHPDAPRNLFFRDAYTKGILNPNNKIGNQIQENQKELTIIASVPNEPKSYEKPVWNTSHFKTRNNQLEQPQYKQNSEMTYQEQNISGSLKIPPLRYTNQKPEIMETWYGEYNREERGKKNIGLQTGNATSLGNSTKSDYKYDNNVKKINTDEGVGEATEALLMFSAQNYRNLTSIEE